MITNYRHWLNRMVLFLGLNLSVSQAINPLPYIVQAQRLFAQPDLLRRRHPVGDRLHTIHDALSFFRNAYDAFASYRAALIRLDGLTTKTTRRAFTRLPTGSTADGALPPRG